MTQDQQSKLPRSQDSDPEELEGLAGEMEQEQFVLYTGARGNVSVSVLYKGEMVWLSQKQLADLFGVNVPAIAKHLKNIFDSGELLREATVSKKETVQTEGTRSIKREIELYNLDAIIAVGYRVNSYQATHFRMWASKTLREFLIKGFVLDDERLKRGTTLFGRDYFDELLERIRDIRASERNLYQKITDIYALSIDYTNQATQTQEFFATVQNKLHWAITGQTAAEMIATQSDASKPFMGLSHWKAAPHGKIMKSDVTVAKNYLQEDHLRALNRVVSAYLDLAEDRAERAIPMRMADWLSFLNNFLKLSDYPVLATKGKVTAEQAKQKAWQEYEVYRKQQDKEYVSDFDRFVSKTRHLQKNPQNPQNPQNSESPQNPDETQPPADQIPSSPPSTTANARSKGAPNKNRKE